MVYRLSSHFHVTVRNHCSTHRPLPIRTFYGTDCSFCVEQIQRCALTLLANWQYFEDMEETLGGTSLVQSAATWKRYGLTITPVGTREQCPSDPERRLPRATLYPPDV